MTKDYSLDTNTCIDLIRGQNSKIRQHFAQAVKAGHTISLCSIALHELSFGAARSQNPERSRNALDVFLSGVAVLDFNEDDAQAAGEVRAQLSKVGKIIGPFDTLIAGQALRRKLIVVSANLGEFKRVPGLTVENWSR